MAKGIRRKYRSDSSEPGQSGAVTVEKFLARKDPYRVAPPNEIPTPWPYVKCRVTQEAEDLLEDIMPDCQKICEKHSITVRDIKVDALMRKDFENRATSCLIIDTGDSDTHRWHEAASDLRDLIQKAIGSAEEFKVEVRNSYKMYSDASSCLPDNANLIQYINEIEPRVMSIVRDKLLSICTSVAFHMRGSRIRQNGPAPRPTVLVFVKPGSYIFEEVELQLLQALTTSSFPDMEMNLEILPGTISGAIDMDSDPRCLSHLTSTIPFNGVSIGARNLAHETGSLGGWIRLTSKTDPKQIMDCMMTAYHTFAKADEENELDNAVSGIGFYGPNLPDIEVVWPSNLDEHYTRSICEKEVQEGSENAEFATALAVLNTIRNSGRTIGKISYASGHRVRSPLNRRLDWALIPSPQTSQLNRPPKLTIYSSPYIKGTYSPGPDDYVRNFGPGFQKDNWVVRAGRTSTRQGFVNKVHRTVFWEDKETHPESKEVEILPLDNTDFCGAGDSGSWVMNEKYELVGMLIGNSNGQDREGLVTPIKDLVDDIERRTNCKVSLP